MTPNVERQTGETWHLAEGGNLPGRVWFRLTPDGRGGLVCTECAIEADRPLTTTVLRSVPLTLLIEELLAQPLQLDDEIDELVPTDPDVDLSLYRLPDSTLRTFYMANAKKPAKARPKNRRGGPGRPTTSSSASLRPTAGRAATQGPAFAGEGRRRAHEHQPGDRPSLAEDPAGHRGGRPRRAVRGGDAADGTATDQGGEVVMARPTIKAVQVGDRTRYRFVVDIGPDPKTGKRRQQTKTYDSKRQAERELSRILNEVNTGAYAGPSKVTLGEYLDEWLRSAVRGKSPNTESAYRHGIAPAKDQLGAVPLQKLTTAHVEDLIDWMLTEGRRRGGKPGTALSPRSAQITLSKLRTALDGAVHRRLVAFNVAAPVKCPAQVKTKRTPWEPGEVRTFLASLADERLHAPMLLSLIGIRPEEVCGLRWARNVDLDAETLTISQVRTLTWTEHDGGQVVEKDPKTDAGNRTLPLPGPVSAALRALKAAAGPRAARRGRGVRAERVRARGRAGPPVQDRPAAPRGVPAHEGGRCPQGAPLRRPARLPDLPERVRGPRPDHQRLGGPRRSEHGREGVRAPVREGSGAGPRRTRNAPRRWRVTRPRPEQRMTDAIALIRNWPPHPDDDDLERWRGLARAYAAEYAEPTALAEGLVLVARDLARFVEAATGEDMTVVLDAVYSRIVDVAAQGEGDDAGEKA